MCNRDPNTRKFLHSDPSSRPGQGESLAWGTGLSGNNAANLWYNEIGNYSFANPVYTASPQVVHFTQMVWRTTTQIGCASATCGGEILWVCRYMPAGNINVNVRQSLIDNVPPPCMP